MRSCREHPSGRAKVALVVWITLTGIAVAASSDVKRLPVTTGDAGGMRVGE